MSDEALKRAGMVLAKIGADIYCIMDRLPSLEEDEEMQQIMYLMNKVSYRLMHGKERPQ